MPQPLDFFTDPTRWSQLPKYEMPQMAGPAAPSPMPMGPLSRGNGPLGTPLFPLAPAPQAPGAFPTNPQELFNMMFAAGPNDRGPSFGPNDPAAALNGAQLMGVTSPMTMGVLALARAAGLDLPAWMGPNMEVAPTPAVGQFSGGNRSANAAMGPQGYDPYQGLDPATVAAMADQAQGWGGWGGGFGGGDPDAGHGFGSGSPY